MRIAVAESDDGAGVLASVDDTMASVEQFAVADLAPAVAAREAAASPRWIWAASDRVYAGLLRAGVRVERCHDLELAEALLLAHEGRYGEPSTLAAAWARTRGIPVPASNTPASSAPTRDHSVQSALFETEDAAGADIEAVLTVHADQQRRLAAAEHPARLGLLIAAESAAGLAAAEINHAGLPWRAGVHDEQLTALLGPRPAPGLRPRKLQELADAIRAAFGGEPVNPDSPAQLVRAFAAIGIKVPSTRSEALRLVDHPAVPVLLRYKELARLHAAHGWAWCDTWVDGGRFRPGFVVGGVVSGRWATSGGGALQIPRVLRRAVVADPGWTLVVADAEQLEPRVLAALADDRGFTAAAAEGDLYEALAGAFGGVRDKAKVALLSAMYGGASGEAAQLLGVLRRRFPAAAGYVEEAAREGEAGRLVRSRLGRTSPLPSAAWRELASSPEGAAAVRSRGRFTRNFVVQASAADWALVFLATLRRRLVLLDGPQLVFFQHDEVIVHAPREQGEAVAAAMRESSEEAGHRLFGDTTVRFPLGIAIVDCYADAK